MTESNASPSTAGRPRRPRIPPGLPVISRAHDEAQLGQQLAVRGGEDIYERLTELDGRCTRRELLDRAAEPARVDELLDALDEAGVLEDADGFDVPGPVPYPNRLAGDIAARTLHGTPGRHVLTRRANAAVVVHGDGRIGIALALALAAAGVGWVRLAASGTVRAQDCGTGFTDADVDQPREHVGRRRVTERCGTTRAGPLPASRTPELVVFTDTPVPEPAAATPLRLARVPHMLAYARDHIGVVGPFVVPGQTGCTRCLDLWRTGQEPCWPRLATQLAGVPQPCPLTVAHAVAAFAAAQALRFLDGDRMEHLRDAAVDFDPDTFVTQRRTWYRHPACGCEHAATSPPRRRPLPESQPRGRRFGPAGVVAGAADTAH